MNITIERVAFAGVSLRKYASFPRMSEETTAFAGEVFHEESGRRIGNLVNRGTGGQSLFTGVDREGNAAWDQALAAYEPILWSDGSGISWGLDDALSVLAGDVADMTAKAKQKGYSSFLVGEPRGILGSEELHIASTNRSEEIEESIKTVATNNPEVKSLVYGAAGPGRGTVDIYLARW